MAYEIACWDRMQYIVAGYGRAGSISETLRIAQLADVFGLSWASHVSTSTAIHLMAGLHAEASPTSLFLNCRLALLMGHLAMFRSLIQSGFPRAKLH